MIFRRTQRIGDEADNASAAGDRAAANGAALSRFLPVAGAALADIGHRLKGRAASVKADLAAKIAAAKAAAAGASATPAVNPSTLATLPVTPAPALTTSVAPLSPSAAALNASLNPAPITAPVVAPASVMTASLNPAPITAPAVSATNLATAPVTPPPAPTSATTTAVAPAAVKTAPVVAPAPAPAPVKTTLTTSKLVTSRLLGEMLGDDDLGLAVMSELDRKLHPQRTGRTRRSILSHIIGAIFGDGLTMTYDPSVIATIINIDPVTGNLLNQGSSSSDALGTLVPIGQQMVPMVQQCQAVGLNDLVASGNAILNQITALMQSYAPENGGDVSGQVSTITTNANTWIQQAQTALASAPAGGAAVTTSSTATTDTAAIGPTPSGDAPASGEVADWENEEDYGDVDDGDVDDDSDDEGVPYGMEEQYVDQQPEGAAMAQPMTQQVVGEIENDLGLTDLTNPYLVGTHALAAAHMVSDDDGISEIDLPPAEETDEVYDDDAAQDSVEVLGRVR